MVTAGISYSSEGVPCLQITVRDTGIGIRPEDRDKIFQMLGKLEATASINTSGVGLGLSTCKKIIEALEGTIEILDEERGGSQTDDLFETKYASSEIKTKSIGTAIALTLRCKEIEDMAPRVRPSGQQSYYESNAENLGSSMYSQRAFEDQNDSMRILSDQILD